MVRYPLNRNVFSYREGISTETALHKVTYTIEKALANKQYAMAIFLDISGAFSNTATHSMTSSLAKKGLETQLLYWIDHLLTGRIAIATLGNDTISKNITTGAAEGGILSPALFNNVMSEAADRFPEDSGTDLNVFADDMNLLRVGYDIWNIGLHLQGGVNCLSDWAKSKGLKFNAEKTKVMIFTRKYKFEKPIIMIDRKNLEYVDTFKYLGILFDSKLSWKAHLKAQAEKAKASLLIGRRMLGKQWGLSPKVTNWLYTAIVRPILSYGAIIWFTSLEVKQNRDRINRVQRLACKMITGGMRSTPTAGMEILLGMTPITDTVKEIALATSTRITKAGYWLGTPDQYIFKSHAHTLNTIKRDLLELSYPQDKSHIKIRIRNNFDAFIKSRNYYGQKHITPMPHDIIATSSTASLIDQSQKVGTEQLIL